MHRGVVLSALVLLVAAGSAWAAEPDPAQLRENLARLGAHAGDRTFRIPSSAMEPTLRCPRPASGCTGKEADRILVRPYPAPRPPARGDVIVFAAPSVARAVWGAGGVFVKRIVGLPGETVAERGGFVYVNGRRLAEPYVRGGRRDERTISARRVPAGSYWLLGDNRRQSCDSREWGTVREKSVIGRAIGIYWPTARFRRL